MDPRPQTLAEQILSHASGRRVYAGDLVIAEIARCMSHDSLTPEVIDTLQNTLGAAHVFDPDRVAVIVDHVAPAASVATANAQVRVRRWVADEGIRHFYDVGYGVCHQVMIEEQLVGPGDIALGTDSHATAYGAVCALGTGVGSRDMALTLATGRNWLRVPETIRVQVRGRFGPTSAPRTSASTSAACWAWTAPTTSRWNSTAWNGSRWTAARPSVP
jgi:methanogen homoaconitase large subunit